MTQPRYAVVVEHKPSRRYFGMFAVLDFPEHWRWAIENLATYADRRGWDPADCVWQAEPLVASTA